MRRIDPRLRLLALVGVVASLLVLVIASGGVSAERVRDEVDRAGPWAPLVFILVSACLTPAFFPGPILAAASGLLFGITAGVPISLASTVLGASIAFSISRWVAGDVVEEKGGPRVRALADWVGERGFVSVLLARITPGVPYSAINYAAGLAPKLALPTFAAATALGAAPRTYAYVALGGSLDDLARPEALVAFAILIVMAIGGLVLLRRARRSGPGTGSSSPDDRSEARP